jgi:hypothetical protein
MEQTALQYFLCGLIDLEIGKGIPTDKQIQLEELYKKAREIQKQQIEDAYDNGLFDGTMTDTTNRVYLKYYNNKYGGTNE